jgi:hypothetical protein
MELRKEDSMVMSDGNSSASRIRAARLKLHEMECRARRKFKCEEDEDNTVEVWERNGSLFLFVVSETGWEIYIPAISSALVDDTFSALEKYLSRREKPVETKEGF